VGPNIISITIRFFDLTYVSEKAVRVITILTLFIGRFEVTDSWYS